MTIKEAFQKLSKVTNAGIKNPWFVIRNLGQTFADVADKISYSEINISKVLWVNPAPSSDYGEGTVTITGGDKYDAFIVYFLPIASGSNALQSFMYPASWINDSTDHGAGFIEYNVTNGKINRDYRMMRLTQAADSHDVVLNFAHGRASTIATYGTAGSSTNDDAKMKPLIIVGEKFSS